MLGLNPSEKTVRSLEPKGKATLTLEEFLPLYCAAKFKEPASDEIRYPLERYRQLFVGAADKDIDNIDAKVGLAPIMSVLTKIGEPLSEEDVTLLLSDVKPRDGKYLLTDVIDAIFD